MTAPIRSGKHLSPEERAEKIYESSMDEGYLAVDLKEFRDIIATQIREAEEAVALNVRVDTVLEITQGIKKIMDQNMASEIERLKKESYDEGVFHERVLLSKPEDVLEADKQGFLRGLEEAAKIADKCDETDWEFMANRIRAIALEGK